jgi:aspartyl-tRNA(Asn)/glutamyl-tRNA(Gln) amidotransferase subunit A
VSAVDISDLTELTLVDAADGLRRRAFSSLELTDACLARIDRAQPQLNCFISIDPERARDQARQADAANGTGLLAGVPLAHKDMFYRRGRISTCGSKIRRDVVADITATVLNRLDDAGALEIGTLNMSEFAAGATGHNVHFGDCVNPWKAGYAPGGSSSGSGAAVAARLVFGALGSDTGGSVRLPAYFCGLAGLRPTYGRVSRFGAMPRSWSADAVGPLARTVRDAARLLQVIAGADANDPTSEQVAVPDYEQTIESSLKGLRIGRPTNFFYDNLDDERRAMLDASLAVLRELGAQIVEIEVPDLAPLFAAAQLVLKAEATALHETWLVERPDDYALGIRTEMEAGLFIPATRYIAALRQRGAVLAEFAKAVFGEVDVLHTPVYEYPTPSLAECNPDSAAGAAKIMATFGRCTRPFSFLGLPALTVPAGFTDDGLPTGFQLVGQPFAEAAILNVGHLYQRETDWHERAPALV